MQELAKTIEMVPDQGHEYTLRAAASKWAAYCIETYDGKMLRKGLTISTVLAEFMNEFERNMGQSE